mmetsp:Transcript_99735/g.302813  ORF Transcript_99735/g.302813 Transcript_99735/m.302813 type:complete len:370 (+) Transcript_99735:201-1310(+)
MYCIWPLNTRHGFFSISSVGSGCSTPFFSPSPSPSFFSRVSFEDVAPPLPLAASPEALPAAAFVSPSDFAAASAVGFSSSLGAGSFGAAGVSSTIICSLARSLAATDSVAAEPTTVVPGVAATDMPSPLLAKPPSATELLTEAPSMSTSASAFSCFFSLLFSSSAAFFSRSALALAAVDSTAVAVFACSSFFGGCRGSGYAKSEGRAPHFREKFFGIFSFSVRPMSAFGARVRENMWMSGNQYHIWVKRQNPMAAPRRSTPDEANNEADELRPLASITPLARMAPKRVMTSSCLSPMTFCSFPRNSFTRSVLPGEVCMYSRPIAMMAPCRTKSDASDINGWSKLCASSCALPAQAMPSARAEAYRTCGL